MIGWIPSALSGKAIPVDLERIHALRRDDHDGARASDVVLVTDEGVTLSARRVPEDAANVSGYISHWASCPQARDFRTARRA